MTCAHSMAAQARERDRETRVEREVRQERGEEGRPYSQPVKCAVQCVTNPKLDTRISFVLLRLSRLYYPP